MEERDGKVIERRPCDSQALGARLRQVRIELLGEGGPGELARSMGVPVRTWINYEVGVTIPGPILLKFIERTRVEPAWLLTGRGARFRTGPAETGPTLLPSER